MATAKKTSKSLVIVESPAKARTINKFLGKGYVVKASMGHVRDLPKTKLGVDEEASFAPTYVLVPDKKKKAVVTELKKAAAKVSDIYLAPDPDREGEAISFHLKEILSQDSQASFHRVRFNEITRKAILEAFTCPTEINDAKVNAQQARRILDRLVGYKVSPLLWEKVRRGLSAGRVQSVALRMITEREREIQAFKPEEYWSLSALLKGPAPPPFRARVVKVDGKKAQLPNDEATQRLMEAVRQGPWRVSSVQAKERKRQPAPPFITSQLQQAAARQYGFGVRKTMMIAQRLYEGQEIPGQGRVGLITYMRTDSTRVSADALAAVRGHIQSRYGEAFVPPRPRTFRVRRAAQEAHEAIRPTFVNLAPETVKAALGNDEWKLYRLIWQRFVASQMQPAVFETTTAEIEAGPALFRAAGSVLKFAGFLSVYGEEPPMEPAESDRERAKAPSPEAEDGILPPLQAGQILELEELDPKQHFTQPPPRYSEGTLVKAMEENGIGRPSTYAAIIGILSTREYVIREQKSFKPTELGMMVSDLLVRSFGDLFNIEYTARMEEELDAIEEGRKNWVDSLTEFNDKFRADLVRAKTEMTDVKRQEIPTDQSCSKCGKPMVIRWGRFGRFLACTGYPDCKNTQELGAADEGEAESQPADLSESCEKCGKEMIVKRGRFGRFLACTGYPACKNTRKVVVSDEGKVISQPDRLLEDVCPRCKARLAVKHGRFGEYTACSNYPDCRYIKLEEVGVTCPKDGCQGQVVVRKSRRGRVFYGCSQYPDCDFVAWNRPVNQRCPDCNSPYLTEKATKKYGTQRLCPNESCSFKQTVEVS
ncbi:MAG: type I DNA topoisomerase [Acidobacteriota bacterium]